MNTKHKITIPEPCHQNWDKMTPKDNGRFCLSCIKTVVDFTKMSAEEIQHYFISNQNKSICGRFKNTQLDEIIIQIPNRVLYSQTHYHKMFLLALFIAMGTTLFSCQDKDGNKKKIDKIEVVKKTPNPERTQVGDIKINKLNSTQFVPPPPPPPRVNQIKFTKGKNYSEKMVHMTSGEVLVIPQKEAISKTVNPTKRENKEDNSVFIQEPIIVEPEYPSGIENLKKFIQHYYRFPEKLNIQNDKIQASFVVERDGSLSNFKLIENSENELEEELIRILKKVPKWNPGMQNGKLTMTRYLAVLSIKTDTIKESRNQIIPRIDSISIAKY